MTRTERVNQLIALAVRNVRRLARRHGWLPLRPGERY